MYRPNQQKDPDHSNSGSASFYKIKYNFFGYSDPENIFLDNENEYFSGWADRYFS